MTAPTAAPLVSLHDVREAHRRIADHVVRSPLVELPSGVVVKAESLQPSGSFKLRGAFNTVLQLDEAQRRAGIVAHSSGNHAIAVAFVGRALDIPTVVVMPRDAPRVKLDRTRELGAEVVLVGPASNERVARAAELVDEHGYRLIEPYDSAEVIAATGTIAVEILDDHPQGPGAVTEIYVPVSGGGLAAGIATAATALDDSIRVIGVEPEVAADALATWTAGHIVELPAEQMARTSADGLRVQRVGARPWEHLRTSLAGVVTVSEDEIAEAMWHLAGRARLVAEPSGAVAVAAALAADRARPDRPGRRVAVLSGGNVDPSTLIDALTRGDGTLAP